MVKSGGIVIGGEIQIPYHDPKYWATFIRFIKEYEPVLVHIIGDFLDCPAPSRWNRGTAQEYAGNLQGEVNIGKYLLGELRDSYDGPITYSMGNHEKRIDVYAQTKAPAFAGLEALRVSNLLCFDQLGITEVPTFFQAAPNLLITHGDAGRLRDYGGGTAIAAARNQGMSVVCGHTHRHGIIYERHGRKNIFGMETGHGMSVAKAEYIKTGNPNWSMGWGTVDVSGNNLHPQTWVYRNGGVHGLR